MDNSVILWGKDFMMRVGYFGGSFNPVHEGHLAMARAAARELGLDRVLFVPAPEPPHKSARGLLPYTLRWHLLRVAVAGLPQLGTDETECLLEGPSYTVRTLAHFAAVRPGQERWFLLGGEGFLQLPDWNRGRELARFAHLAVFPRGRSGLDTARAFARGFWPQGRDAGAQGFDTGLGHRIRFLDVPRSEASASAVRELFLTGGDWEAYVPCAVARAMRLHAATLRRVWSVV